MKTIKSSTSKTAFVLGNGASRLNLANINLKHYGLVIGCNRAYQDYHLDALCAVDQPMIYDLIELHNLQPYIDSSNHKRWPHAKYIDTNTFARIDSGTLAMLVSQHLQAQEVFLLGFDYITQDKTINNVYAGTVGYHLATDPHPDRSITDQWEHNHQQVCYQHPNTKFLRININNYVPKIAAKNYFNITQQEFGDILARR